jgi:hypothetical protein
LNSVQARWQFTGRTLLTGTVLGLLILGAGGRIVMAVITADAGGAPRFTLGGTMTVVMLATLLLLVTIRGLRGTPQPGSWYFYPLVALYGVALVWLNRGHADLRSRRPP